MPWIRGDGECLVDLDDSKEVARNTMERSIPLILQWDENFDIGGRYRHAGIQC